MIESITLQGFKSFAARTRLEFGPGVNAIIGPNGSGKSNVVEAIRWVTHQARARELRAAHASELIFHGSGAQAPLGLAEVRLELRARTGPVNSSNTTSLNISRRLYRGGAAEQDLSGKAVRVRDLHAALRGTGLGPGGLAVIGQGEVANVVQAESAALLGHLQEAAGLGRAVAARQDTETRLRGAETSLRELRLIETERAAGAGRLSQAAASARRARTLSLRELALTDALTRARQDSLRAEVEAARRQAAQAEAESAALSLQTSAALARTEHSREALHAERAAAQQAETELRLRRAAEQARSQLALSLAHLRRESLALEREATPPEAPGEPETDPAPTAAALARGRAEAGRLDAERRALETDLSRARRLEAQQAQDRARAEALGSALEAEYSALDAQRPAQLAALETARSQLQEAALAHETAAAQLQLLTQQRRDLETLLRALGTRQAELAATRSALDREHSRLERALSSYARYAEGPRQALLSGHPGVVGSVADLLQVAAEYQVAVGAALGRRLEQVVVLRADDAREIIETLKREGGRATFLPLDLLRAPGSLRGSLLAESGVVGSLAELCPSDPPAVSFALLQGTLLLDDLNAATRLARRHASRPRLVTRDGELIEPGGALTGGRLQAGNTAVLADTRRLGELNAERQTLERQSQAFSTQLAALKTRLDALDAPADPAALLAAERRALLRVNELETALRLADARHLALAAGRSGEAVPEAVVSDLPAFEARLAGLQSRLDAWRLEERQLSEALAQRRELAARWINYRAALGRQAAARQRLEATAAALAEQEPLLAQAETELARLRAETSPTDLLGPVRAAEAEQSRAESGYAELLARQNAVRARLEQSLLTAARREGSLEAVPEGPLLPGAPRDWSAELSAVRAELSALGPVNARAEAEHLQAAAELAALSAQVGDAESAASELHLHLADLARQEADATEAAYRRVGDAFARYSRELLGGFGELEAERSASGTLTGLRLSVQPEGKRTRSLNLLSAGERTMAGLGFLFALSGAQPDGAQGLPLAVLDEVDAPLDEANIRRFTHFLEVFAARGAQFLLVTHQKATMEVAQAIWGVTTDTSGASSILSIRQGEHA
jgi:chromosome segregation protein